MSFAIQLLTISRAHDDRYVRSNIQQVFRQFETVHFGHLPISNHQIELVGVSLEKLKRLKAAVFTRDLVPETLQHPHSHLQKGLIVVDQENSRIPIIGKSRPIGIGFPTNSILDSGEKDPKGAPFSQLAFHFHRAAEAPHDPVDHSQPHAAPLAKGLGAEKRIENAFHNGSIHSAPGVTHCHLQVRASF